MSKSKKELAHDQFFYDLYYVTEKAKDLEMTHVVYVGIKFFTQVALDCAPNKKEAKELIKNAMKSAKKEAS